MSNSALSVAMTKLNQFGIERVLRVQYAGSNVRATRRSFAEACEALAEAAANLDLPTLPDLYVDWHKGYEAYTICPQKPLVIITSGLLRILTYEELLFVLGHEIGHIKSRQVVYSQMALIMPVIGELIKSATLGIGSLVSGGLQVSLTNWLRMADFSADRAGLLACQSPDDAARALIKLGGVPGDLFGAIDLTGFCAQARDFGTAYDFETLDKAARVVSALATHQEGESAELSEVPTKQAWTVMRAAELFKWIDTDGYQKLMARATAAAQSDIAAEHAAEQEESPAETTAEVPPE